MNKKKKDDLLIYQFGTAVVHFGISKDKSKDKGDD